MKRYLRENTIALVGQMASIVQAIVLIPLLVQSAGAATYGAWALLSSMLSFVYGVSPFGMSYRTARFLPTAADSAAKRALFYPQLIFQTCTLLALGLPLLAYGSVVASAQGLKLSLPAGVLYLLTYQMFGQTNQYLRYTNRVSACIAQSAIQTYVQIAAAIALAAEHRLSIDMLLVSQSAVMLVAALPVIAMIRRELGGPLAWPTMLMLRGDVAVGLPMVASFIVDTTLSVGDRYVMAGYLPMSDVGAYAAAYALGSLPLVFPRAIGMVVPQMLSHAVDSGQRERARSLVAFSIQWFLLLAVPFVAGAWVLGGPVLMLVANAEVAAKAALVVPVVAAGTLIYGVGMLTSHLLFVHAKTKSLLSSNLLAALSNVVFNTVLLSIVPSVVVPAFVTVISYAIMLSVLNHRLPVEWRVGADARLMLTTVGAAAGMAVVIQRLPQASGHAVLSIGISVAIGVATYAILLAVFGGDTVRQRWRQAREMLA